MIRAIEDICSGLIENKINRILILNGHDGNIAPIEISARTIKDRYPDVVIACLMYVCNNQKQVHTHPQKSSQPSHLSQPRIETYIFKE
jgi:creatinine amidohydrolase/Fe(II)-dependent formamide hydrolase-like protein